MEKIHMKKGCLEDLKEIIITWNFCQFFNFIY